MRQLIDRFKTYLQVRTDALRCFCRWGVQVEGWFKGEMLAFLDQQRRDGIIEELGREVRIDPLLRGRIDFMVRFPLKSAPTWIELKHWLIGHQGGVAYNANWYFNQGNAANGVRLDVNRLSTIANGEKYVVIAATAAPTKDDWLNGINAFNQAAGNGAQVECLTSTAEYPDYFFLGLLHVLRKPPVKTAGGCA